MDMRVFAEVDKEIPNLTRELAEGFAYDQLTTLKPINIRGEVRPATVNEQYINELFEQASKSFPSNLRYVGYRHVTPEEEFTIITNRRREAKRYYDVSKSDVYLVNYLFTLDGEAIDPVPLYLPFTRRGGIIMIRGAKFMISPTIVDVALSVNNDGIFLMGNRFKLTFDRLQCNLMIDGERHSEYVMWSQVYNVKDNRTIRTTLPHYLFCKFGVQETFNWFGIDARFVSEEFYQADRQSENPEYPESEWVRYAPVRKNNPRIRFQQTTKVVILTPRSQQSHLSRTLGAAFYYTASYFPEKITPEDFNSPALWRRLLGRILFGTSESEGKLINQIDTHMGSIDDYVDAMVTRWLAAGGYENINTIYELFKLVITVGNELIINGRKDVSSLYGKRYVVNRYVNRDIVNGISNFLFSVKKHVNSGKVLKPGDVKKLFNTYLPYGLALKINRDHSEVKSVSSASDCLIHKITSVTLLQTEASTSGTGPAFGPDKHLDMSISEAGGHSNQPSRDPSGRSSINPWVTIDAEGTILRNPKYIERMDEYQALIRR